ncbi:MAG: putative ral secretion pathway protein, partial [Pseudomonas sp.]|nr:putative ral secretion pathway protein [Pseudomonas sp.]
MNRSRLLMSLVCLCAGLAACSSAQVANKEASELIEQGQYEAGLARIQEGLRENPRDTELHLALNTARVKAINALLTDADTDRARRDFSDARVSYSRVLTIEPNNRRAQDALRQLEYLRSMDEKLELARGDLRRGDIYGADRQVKQILELDPQNTGALELQGNIRLVQSRNVVAYPQLRTRLDRPVTLEFRDANLKTIFEVLSQVAGLNFIFDKDLRPDMKATIFVRDVRIEDAVELLLQQNQLHQKVVNENTLLIYPDSPQKLKDYQELVMRTFYLTSIDANTALNMIKTMLKTRDVFVDERLNTLTMRDSEDAIRMAEKLLQSQDQSNPEVVL